MGMTATEHLPELPDERGMESGYPNTNWNERRDGLHVGRGRVSRLVRRV